MAEKLQMIALSPTMEEGTILKWNKKEGDTVDAGDVLCEVETDKASMEYESAQEGVLLKILQGEGSKSKVGDVIGVIGEAGEDIAAFLKEIEKEASGAGSAAAPAATGGAAPAAADSSMNAGAWTAAGQAAMAAAGISAGAPAPTGAGKSSPLARKIAEQKGIDIGQVPGTGPAGRVIKRDVEGFKGAPVAVGAGAAAGGKPAPQLNFAAAAMPAQDTIIPVSGMRAAIARKVSETKRDAVHFYIKNSVEMDALIAARTMLNKEAPFKVSFNAFIIKLCAEAIKRYPLINSSWQGDKILQFGSIDIALAVDLGNGLYMPVVRNVGNKGIVQIDSELKELIDKAGKGTLRPEEYTGATFSISNLGSFGVEEFTAVINTPGSAILALGEVKKTPVYDEAGNIRPANIMKMNLSADHRVIDGSLGGKFLSELKRSIENPVRVLF